jgi:hypothetical protein
VIHQKQKVQQPMIGIHAIELFIRGMDGIADSIEYWIGA